MLFLPYFFFFALYRTVIAQQILTALQSNELRYTQWVLYVALAHNQAETKIFWGIAS